MEATIMEGAGSPVGLLRRLARKQAAQECCDFCSVPLPPDHRHLLEIATRKSICACTACALRFDHSEGRFRLIPRDTRRLPDFRITDAQWESLSLPIHLAFFFRSTPAGRVVALYPSPAGATESLLPLASWEALVTDNPILGKMQPDIEALLTNRLKRARGYYLAPIDVCFGLVGLIRVHWRGLTGGDKVWQEIEAFFARLGGQPGADGEARNGLEARHA